jgi:hypothetical protein
MSPAVEMPGNGLVVVDCLPIPCRLRAPPLVDWRDQDVYPKVDTLTIDSRQYVPRAAPLGDPAELPEPGQLSELQPGELARDAALAREPPSGDGPLMAGDSKGRLAAEGQAEALIIGRGRGGSLDRKGRLACLRRLFKLLINQPFFTSW